MIRTAFLLTYTLVLWDSTVGWFLQGLVPSCRSGPELVLLIFLELAAIRRMLFSWQQKYKRPSPTAQAHFKPLLLGRLQILHWSWQVTCPRPISMGNRSMLLPWQWESGKGGGLGNGYLPNNNPISHIHTCRDFLFVCLFTHTRYPPANEILFYHHYTI